MRSTIHFVIVTALEEELRAVLAQLKNCKQLPPTTEDVQVYYQCRIKTRLPDGSHRRLFHRSPIAAEHGQGRSRGGNRRHHWRWRPQYVLLVGIAGGIADAEVWLGDVIVGDQIVDYELQKVTPKGPAVGTVSTAPTPGCWRASKLSYRRI